MAGRVTRQRASRQYRRSRGSSWLSRACSRSGMIPCLISSTRLFSFLHRLQIPMDNRQSVNLTPEIQTEGMRKAYGYYRLLNTGMGTTLTSMGRVVLSAYRRVEARSDFLDEVGVVAGDVQRRMVNIIHQVRNLRATQATGTYIKSEGASCGYGKVLWYV